MFESSRIFITGGAGFIGTHLAERLVDTNHHITLFDNFHRNAVAATGLAEHPKIRLIEGDVEDGESVVRAMAGHDVVFHCAAIAGIDSVGRNPVKTLKVNVLGSVNVLDAAARQDSMRRVVCFSTSEVYGRHADRLDETADARIGPPGEPRWTYSAGKLAEEHLAAAYHLEHGLPTTVVRPFNVYGPRQVGEGAIRNFILRAIEGSPLEIRGDGSAVRAWTYVDDMIEGACRAVAFDAAIGEHFNIGNPEEPITVVDLAHRIVALTSSTSSIVHIPQSMIDVEVRIPDIEKARRLLDFEPAVGLDDGIMRTTKWIQERP